MRAPLPVALLALLPILVGASDCGGGSGPAPKIPPDDARVIKVEPHPANPAQEIVTVRWPDSRQTQVRLAIGLCTTEPPRNVYPRCADG